MSPAARAQTAHTDVIYVTESRWDTATALPGATQPHRTIWVRADWESLLSGATDAVRAALEAEGHEPRWTAIQRQVGQRTVGSDQRNWPFMRSYEHLAWGWPIGTWVVEGAYRPLVNDRLGQPGLRWTTVGAQAVLDLRAVRLNGPWEAYGPYHRHPQTDFINRQVMP
jgi:hypothetical protein